MLFRVLQTKSGWCCLPSTQHLGSKNKLLLHCEQGPDLVSVRRLFGVDIHYVLEDRTIVLLNLIKMKSVKYRYWSAGDRQERGGTKREEEICLYSAGSLMWSGSWRILGLDCCLVGNSFQNVACNMDARHISNLGLYKLCCTLDLSVSVPPTSPNDLILQHDNSA